MRPFHMHCAIAAAAIGCVLPAIAIASTHDAAVDFSTTLNPNGVWSFGYSTTLGGAFNLYTNNGASGGLDYWSMNAGGPAGLPGAFHNPTGTTITGATAEAHGGQLIMHPGSLGEYAIARFTAQFSGMHVFFTTFTGEDFVYPTTTDVHVLINGGAIYSGAINTFHGTAGTSLFGSYSVFLNTGDTIDAAVGYGTAPFSDYFGDSTGLAFRVEAPVPTPGAAALLGLGGVMATRRRRS